MYDDDDLQVVGTTSDYLIQQLTDAEEGKGFAVDYFKSGFMSSAVNALFYMRRQAGLTQAQVAERLNTKQSAIARLESDVDGGISLRRYVEFALACGMVPHDITFAPLESVVNYKVTQPGMLYTQVNYQEWLKANAEPTLASAESVVQAESASEEMSELIQPKSDAVFSMERCSTSAPTDSSTVTSSAATLHEEEYFQPHLIPPLQLLPSGKRTNAALASPDKIANLTPSKVS